MGGKEDNSVMITQIYSIHSIKEAKMCLEAGAEHIGVALDTGMACPREVDFDTCKAIFELIGKKAKKVLIIVSLDERPVLEYVSRLRPDIIHICGNEYRASKELVDKLKAIDPKIEVMQAIGLPNPKAKEEALYFASFCDYLILDSINPAITSIGVAGKTHSWEEDKEIVELVKPTKVIMAGGLGPDNVYEAIKTVRPYGVDSFTKTSDKVDGVLLGKNKEKTFRFVSEAHRAFAEIEGESD